MGPASHLLSQDEVTAMSAATSAEKQQLHPSPHAFWATCPWGTPGWRARPAPALAERFLNMSTCGLGSHLPLLAEPKSLGLPLALTPGTGPSQSLLQSYAARHTAWSLVGQGLLLYRVASLL